MRTPGCPGDFDDDEDFFPYVGPFRRPLTEIEEWLREKYPQLYPSSVSPIRCGRRWKTAAGRVGDWTVMSAQTDPFRMDTDGNHPYRDGQWFADAMNRLRIVALHNRGLHYAFLGQPQAGRHRLRDR